MNRNEPHSTVNPTDGRVLLTLHSQQLRLKWLTAVAVAFWSLAVAASVGVLVAYAVFYAPKEKQMFRDYEQLGHIGDGPNSPKGANDLETQRLRTDRALGLHFTMNWVMTKGILATAISVIILSCGTLTTLLVVIFNRRVTLRQINISLAQISEQLKELQNSRQSAA